MNGFAGRANACCQVEQPEPGDEPRRTAMLVPSTADKRMLEGQSERGLRETSTVDLWPLDLWRWVVV